MAILPILKFPDPRLRIKGIPITEVNSGIRKQIDDMFATMYDAKGVGLAATQVNIPLQMFVLDVSEAQNEPHCFINPKIIHREGTQYEAEGCLSVEEAFDKVERAMKVRVQALDKRGKQFELEVEQVMAVCIQHEMDHLNGILFIDHLSRLKQERIRKRIAKVNR